MSVIRSLTADELRSKYLAFFRERGHAIIKSASLIPENDPSVLYTTAGMHPLVPYLLGRPHPNGVRLANVQKCVRTGDIDEVGDNSHLTFFEMLGNWSLGDYFKKESITWSYEFLTKPEWLGIPVELIHVSVFEGDAAAPCDEEAAQIWRSLGIPEERISYLSAEHNWWAAGPEGPCGPDTEIFIDTRPGEPLNGGLDNAANKGRFVEIWNNVFMSFNRTGDKVTDLPKNNVDTGMGLERTLAILNGVESPYETSCFAPIVARLLESAGRSREPLDERSRRAVRILSDHLRTSVFILGDERGVTPSNTGAGYVLRRLIRRAIRFCDQLGLPAQKWAEAAQVVIDNYREAYPELAKNEGRTHAELKQELERFQKTLKRGTQMLEEEIEKLKASGQTVLPGKSAFKMFDTYGFPIELTQEQAAEAGLGVDVAGYREEFEQHRIRSQGAAAKSGLADTSAESIRYHTATHLLHAALRKVLGEHVVQKGSNITRERLRFDFSHPAKMTKEEIAACEKFVQDAIDRGLEVTHESMTPAEAKVAGAIGLFDDRYSNDVTVYSIGDVSKEICAGPHVGNTREIGQFKIKKEEASSAGVRRIRAEVK
jgi:alanyl-tRNA synthetase